jgi:hypothetical protein
MHGALAVAAMGGLLLGCSTEEGPKAWSALSTCLAGKAAQEPLAARFRQLRLIQLANPGKSPSKDAWPGRCSRYADTLYTALPTSGTPALLRRQMQQKFGCSDDKASCAITNDAALATMATDLWAAADSAGLKSEAAAPDVPMPEAAAPPLLDEKGWKSFSDKPVSISGPALTPDGRALLVLKSPEGRTRPKGCEFAAGFAKVHCVEANAQVPELPGQTVELVPDAKGLFASSLTEKGLVAYNLQTGETSDVRGTGRRLIRDGVAVEKGAKDDLSAPAPMAAPAKRGEKAAKGKPTVKEEGFIAVEVLDGKASKEVKLAIKSPVGDPIAIGNQVVFLNQTEGGVELVAQALSRGRLQTKATLKGQFSGSLHSCRNGDQLVVATYGSRSGQQNAKPTGGAGRTQLSLALFKDGAWSKTVETTLPFERAHDSGLVCTKLGASLVWVQPGEGGVQVGRIDCSADGCKATDTKVVGVESKWWWSVGPVGDKVFLLWRGSLGETRARVAPIAELGTAKDTLVFDSPDFGGPTAGELSALLSENAALFVFRNEQPVALQLGAEGTPRVIGL